MHVVKFNKILTLGKLSIFRALFLNFSKKIHLVLNLPTYIKEISKNI